ncbi:MAG: GRP family sugar transporter [Bifidobacterium sp.]|nr:GRP family sugar transporter [Bifidobacterium sp.]
MPRTSRRHRYATARPLIASTLGFMMYFLFPNLLHQTGFIPEAVYEAPDGNSLYYMCAVILPQAVGMVITALAIVILVDRDASLIFARKTGLNILNGLVWATGNVLIFISAANPAVGQAIATTFSQLGVVVSTYGGIVFLHERKTRRQMVLIAIGTVCIVVGAVLMGLYTTT